MGLTISAVARKLGVSVRTVVEWDKRGLLPAQRSAAGWRYFDPNLVEAFLSDRQARFSRGEAK